MTGPASKKIRTSKRKSGRPSRAEASAKALEGIDVSKVDPRHVLQSIAADVSAPATARIAACRALLQSDGDKPVDVDDPVTRLALKYLSGAKK